MPDGADAPATTMALAVACVLNSSLSVVMTLSFGFLRMMVRRCAVERAGALARVGLGPGTVARSFGGLFVALIAFDCLAVLAFTTRPTAADVRRDATRATEPSLLACLAAASSLSPCQVILALRVPAASPP